MQHSISGQFNNKIKLDILKFHQDSLTNIFSQELTWKEDPTSDFSFFNSIHFLKKCNKGFFIRKNQTTLPDSIFNKLKFIFDKHHPEDEKNIKYFHKYNKEKNIFEPINFF